MKNLRIINWNPRGMTKDEKAYLRGQVKLLERLGVLNPAPLHSVEMRNRVQDFLSSVRHTTDETYGTYHDVQSKAKQDANALLGLMAGWMESDASDGSTPL